MTMRRCSRCGRMFTPVPGDTHKTCPRCAEYRRTHAKPHSADNRARYMAYREHGICVTCGATWAEPGHVRCKACMEKQRAFQAKHDPTGERRRARRQARIDAGLCIDCGRPTEDGRQRCRRCIDMRMDSTRKYRIMKKIEARAREARKGARI